MSIEIMSTVLHHCNAQPTHKLILLGIANHQGDGGAWPSIDTLATYANVSRRTVSTALRELQRRGDIIVEPNLGRNGTNLYWVTVRCPAECDRTTSHRLLSPIQLDDTHEAHFLPPCNLTSTPMKPTSYKPLRTVINTKESSTEKRLKAQAEWKALETDMNQAKQAASEMPTCTHGLPLLKCQPCCAALAANQ
jgi:DNA-binding transcriptional MocR family regulator